MHSLKRLWAWFDDITGTSKALGPPSRTRSPRPKNRDGFTFLAALRSRRFWFRWSLESLSPVPMCQAPAKLTRAFAFLSPARTWAGYCAGCTITAQTQ